MLKKIFTNKTMKIVAGLGLALLLLVAANAALNRVVDRPESGLVVPSSHFQGIIKNKQEPQDDRVFEDSGEEIISLANRAREENGIEPLSKNEKLMQSAAAKAEDMKEKNYFEHISPDGLQPWFFAEKAGYPYKDFGENLAEGFFSAEKVHEAWMASKGHKENILSKNFEDIGVAILEFEQNDRKSYLIIQHFGASFGEGNSETEACDSKVKEYCRDAEKKKTEIENAIKEQESLINKANENNVADNTLVEAEENLKEMKEVVEKLEDYLEKCDRVIEECVSWK